MKDLLLSLEREGGRERESERERVGDKVTERKRGRWTDGDSFSVVCSKAVYLNVP